MGTDLQLGIWGPGSYRVALVDHYDIQGWSNTSDDGGRDVRVINPVPWDGIKNFAGVILVGDDAGHLVAVSATAWRDLCTSLAIDPGYLDCLSLAYDVVRGDDPAVTLHYHSSMFLPVPTDPWQNHSDMEWGAEFRTIGAIASIAYVFNRSRLETLGPSSGSLWDLAEYVGLRRWLTADGLIAQAGGSYR